MDLLTNDVRRNVVLTNSINLLTCIHVDHEVLTSTDLLFSMDLLFNMNLLLLIDLLTVYHGFTGTS